MPSGLAAFWSVRNRDNWALLGAWPSAKHLAAVGLTHLHYSASESRAFRLLQHGA
jgi:hypothetical protein